MVARGKNYNLFLMDDDVNGRIKISSANWSGVIYKIPRTELNLCQELDGLKRTGIYFLVGKSETTDRGILYIGQAGERKNGEALFLRLKEHRIDPDKDFWTEAFAVTTLSNTFGSTEISYLENCFYNLAKDANRFEVHNNVEPYKGNVTEEKESELLNFIDETKMALGALGYKMFEPVVSESGQDADDEPILRFKGNWVKAFGRRTSDGFAVLKESEISRDIQSSCSEYVKRMRDAYKEVYGDEYVLAEDVLLSSPSAAAGFVGGSSLSGNEYWRNEKGQTLKTLIERELI